MTEPKPPGEILSGRDETAPLRAFSRVWIVVTVAAAVGIGIAFGLWAAGV